MGRTRNARMTCYLCRRRPARRLTARDGTEVYTYAQNVKMFCSQRCAANWALIYARDYTEGLHWCPKQAKWAYCYAAECEFCRCDDPDWEGE